VRLEAQGLVHLQWMNSAAPYNDFSAQNPVQYVLLSDVHLTEIVPTATPEWWSYKRPDAAQDGTLNDFMNRLDAQRPEAYAATVLIFNGDTFDFDSVFAHPDREGPQPLGLPATEPWSVFKMRRLLEDHEPFVWGLARFLARGNQVVFVMGNHDRELAFESVQAALLLALVAQSPPGAGSRVARAVHFEPWFTHVPGVFYAEHGQQYDATCSYRDVLAPFAPPDRVRDAELESSLGSVLGRRLLACFGTINPFDDSSFLRSLGGYVHLAFTEYWPRRSFLFRYLSQSVATYWELRDRRRRVLSQWTPSEVLYDEYAGRKRVDPSAIHFLRRLMSVPVHDRVPDLMHELWLDRFLLVVVTLGFTLAGLSQVVGWQDLAFLVAVLPVFAVTARALGRGSLALQERGRWGLVAEHVAEQLDAPIIAFGHSHRPERRPLRGGGRYYNLGTWAPVSATIPAEQARALLQARRYLVLRPRSGGRCSVAFCRWDG
jgi:UDP-2,3-diacylglucosamine pyrophosphatase LpxH